LHTAKPPENADLADIAAAAAPASNTIQQFTHMAALISTLVVLSHAVNLLHVVEKPTFPLRAYIFFNGVLGIVRMPAFFFISGFLFMHTNPAARHFRYRLFIRKKIVRLLFPFLLFSTFAFAMKIYFGQQGPRQVSLSFSDYALTLCDPEHAIVVFYWFLLALFTMFLVAPLLRQIVLAKSTPLIAATSLALLVLRWQAWRIIPSNLFALQSAAAFLFFFWAGMIAWLWRDRWTSKLHPGVAMLGVIAVISFYTFAPADLHIRFLVILLGIYSVYCFIALYMRKGWKFLRFVDGKTYQIYLMAWFPQQLIVLILDRRVHVNFWICSLLMFVGGICIPLLVTSLVQHYAPLVSPLIGLRSRPIAAPTPEPIPSGMHAAEPTIA
jgi:surface polysaccharide O-acyltransferase-like enzyme